MIPAFCFSSSSHCPGGGGIIYVGYEISQKDILGNNEARKTKAP
jgi:hypothetical protein